MRGKRYNDYMRRYMRRWRASKWELLGRERLIDGEWVAVWLETLDLRP